MTLWYRQCSRQTKKLLQAVFYPGNNGLQAGGVSLTASEPCTVMIKTVAGKSVFTVTDACMNAALKKIRLLINGKNDRSTYAAGGILR